MSDIQFPDRASIEAMLSTLGAALRATQDKHLSNPDPLEQLVREGHERKAALVAAGKLQPDWPWLAAATSGWPPDLTPRLHEIPTDADTILKYCQPRRLPANQVIPRANFLAAVERLEDAQRAIRNILNGGAENTDASDDEFPPMEWVDPEPPHKRYTFGRRKLLWEIWRALNKARRRLTVDDLPDHVPTWKNEVLDGQNVKQALSELRKFWKNQTPSRTDLANRIDNAGGSVALR